MNSATVPSEESWGNWRNDLDQTSAHRLFAGKTLDEVMPLFRRGALNLFDELLFMPPVPFQYYVLAFRDYVMGGSFGEFEEASDVASSFLSLLHAKLRTDPNAIRAVMAELLPVAEYVAANQQTFDAPVEIYGSFSARLKEIRALYQDA